MPATPFNRLMLRAVLRDVYPMVIRLVAVPDSLDLTDFDDIFHALLGWDSGIGFAFLIQGQEFNNFRRKTRSKKFRDFRLHRQEKFLYTLGALDQWEWELRVVDLQDGAEGDETPVCVGGRGAAPPQYWLFLPNPQKGKISPIQLKIQPLLLRFGASHHFVHRSSLLPDPYSIDCWR